ncbi:bifunctional oligoribonuclease/PAP phosphatase NrnA, partial [Gemmatimonadota bacterium]
PTRSSAAELVLEIADSLSVELTPQAADQLFAGVLTDTGCFQYSNTNVHSLRAAGNLVEAGATPSRVADRIYHQRALYFYRLLGHLLGTMELHRGDRICVMNLTVESADALWPEGEMDTEGIVDFTIQVADVEVGIFLRETTPDSCRASLRSRGGVNVQEIAELMGGGGHAGAAGCTLEGTLEETRERLLNEVEKRL